MNYIKAKENGEIQIISQIEIDDYTCKSELLPDDFNKYLLEGKYLANADGLYIKNGWFDFNIKLIISTSFVTDILLTDSDLAKLIKGKMDENALLSKNPKFIVRINENTVAYFLQLDPVINPLTGKLDYDVLLPYIEIGKIKINIL